MEAISITGNIDNILAYIKQRSENDPDFHNERLFWFLENDLELLRKYTIENHNKTIMPKGVDLNEPQNNNICREDDPYFQRNGDPNYC